MPDVYLCPTCDKEAVVGKPCPHCLAHKPVPEPATKKSWEQDEGYDGLYLPDEDFDYEAWVKRELGEDGAPHEKLGIALHWWITAVILLIAFVVVWVLG